MLLKRPLLALLVLGLAFGALLGTARAAQAATPELSSGCALKVLGVLRVTTSSSQCSRFETAVSIRPGPTNVCVLPNGFVRWTARAGLCLRVERQLVLPAVTTTFLCAGPLGHLSLSQGTCPRRSTLYVVSRNRPPTAQSDSYSTDEDTALTVSAPGVLQNDTDPDSDALTVSLVSGPSHAASFTLNSDGSFSYTPAANYHGPDSFSYKASDGKGGLSGTTAVSLTVNPVNDPPMANDFTVSTPQGQAVTIPFSEFISHASDVEGNALSMFSTSWDGATSPHLTVLKVGTSVQVAPAAGWCGSETFGYAVMDSSSLPSNGATVTVNVTCPSAPLAPTGVSTEPATVISSTGATLNGTANPEGQATTGYFRYATTDPGSCDDSFGTATADSSVGSGTTATGFSYGLTGLSASTTYYYCAVAYNTSGKTVASGAPVSFTTAAAGGGGGGVCAATINPALVTPDPKIGPKLVGC